MALSIRTAPIFRPLLLGAAFMLYVAAELSLFPAMGTMTPVLEIIPVMAMAWFYGTAQGIAAAVFLLLWDFAVFLPWGGIDGITRFFNRDWPASAAIVLVAAAIGRLRSLQTRLEVELKERQLVERELIAAQNELEARVAERTTKFEESERDFRLLMEQAPDGIFIFAAAGKVLSANQRACALSGRSAEELQSLYLGDIFPDHSLLDGTGNWQGIEDGNTVLTEQFLQRADGSRIVVEISLQQAGKYRIQAIVRDISERLHAERAVRESEARLNLALHAAEMGMWDWNIESNESVWSDGMHRIFDPMLAALGISKESFLELIHPEDREAVDRSIAKALEEGNENEPLEYEIEFRVVAPDGTVRWMLSRGKAIHDENGRAVRLLGITLDITDRKQNEERLKASEQRFQIVSRATKDLIYEWNIKANVLWWSENLHAILGYPPNQIGSHLEWWEQRLHPDDRPQVSASLREFLEKGEIWEQEYRFRRADGSYAFMCERGYVLRDENGEAIRMIGSVMDISARKLAEDTLRHREEFFRALLENSTDNTTVMTADGVTIYENPCVERLTGHTPGELLGRNNFDLVHPDDIERISARFEEALTSDAPCPA